MVNWNDLLCDSLVKTLSTVQKTYHDNRPSVKSLFYHGGLDPDIHPVGQIFAEFWPSELQEFDFGFIDWWRA